MSDEQKKLVLEYAELAFQRVGLKKTGQNVPIETIARLREIRVQLGLSEEVIMAQAQELVR
ncbi:MAG: hypothetical protein NTZ38_00880 [Candidatus Taylorbacteria bacterium]|nr:hypothetical protein [Candidatus Taylorbacteria bacterium]